MISHDEARQKIINDGIDAMTKSIMQLLEPCIRQRLRQFMIVIEEEIRKEPTHAK